jgi:phospholipase C
VVVVEPSYGDAPHLGSDHPNDNHPPLAMGWGEEFLRRTYEAVTSNPARWGRTVMILYYDEHGGFWDHVIPPSVPYHVGPPPANGFDTLGPRIPAVVVSPLVEAGSTSKRAGLTLDHTSVLQLLAELFTPGRPYSPDVERRRAAGVASVAPLLTRDTPRADTPPAPTDPIRVTSVLGESVAGAPAGPMAEAFEAVALQMMDARPDETAAKYPELVHWRAVREAARAR